jgi:hypothetical protein
MQHMMSAEPGRYLKSRATVNAELVPLFEKPLPHAPSVLMVILVHVKAQQCALERLSA